MTARRLNIGPIGRKSGRLSAARQHRGAMLLWPALATIALAVVYQTWLREQAQLASATAADAQVEAIEMMARRFEIHVHEQSAVAGSDWNLLGQDDAIFYAAPPATFTRSPVDPAHWYDAGGATLDGATQIEWIVAREPGWARPTGLLIARVPDTMAAIDVNRMRRKLLVGDVEAGGVGLTADELFEQVIGRAPTDREIVVFAFDFLGFPREFVWRDNWIGHSRPNLETAIDMGGNDVVNIGSLNIASITSDGAIPGNLTGTNAVIDQVIAGADARAITAVTEELEQPADTPALTVSDVATIATLVGTAAQVASADVSGALLDATAVAAGSGGTDLGADAETSTDMTTNSLNIANGLSAASLFATSGQRVVGETTIDAVTADSVEMGGVLSVSDTAILGEFTSGEATFDTISVGAGGCAGC